MTDSDFLLPGRTCECDVDFHCPNHDVNAEAAQFLPLRKTKA